MKQALFTLVLLTVSAFACAQHPTLKQRMRRLQEQRHVHFVHDAGLRLERSSPEEPSDSLSLEQALARLFAGTGIEYVIRGRNIVLREGRRRVVSGRVTDTEGEPLIHAAVYVPDSRQGTLTDERGRYVLRLHDGRHRIRTSYVGKEACVKMVQVTGDTTLHFTLGDNATLEPVTIDGRRDAALLTTQTGKHVLTADDIRTEFSLLSSPDLVKTLQRISSVSGGIEATSGLYVHGGSGDENLFLLDGSPLYHTNHSLGLFSAFNADIIKQATFYKSGFPARYSGRVSSVTDIRTRDGDLHRLKGSFSLELIDGRVQLEGPLVKGRTSFNVALRRSWLDLLLRPALAVVNSGNGHDGEKYTFDYAFHDLNARITHRLNGEGDILWLSVYSGHDRYGLRDKSVWGRYVTDNRNRFRWGNANITLGADLRLSPALTANFALLGVYSRSHHDADEDDRYHGDANFIRRFSLDVRHNRTRMYDLGGKADFTWMPSVGHHIRFGTQFVRHTFRPQTVTQAFYYGDPSEQVDTTHVETRNHTSSCELTIYAEDEISLSPRWTVNAGCSYTLLKVKSRTYHLIDPRLALKHQLTDDASLKFSYTHMSQSVHRIASTFLELPTDFWVPTTAGIRPTRSDQLACGAYVRPGKLWSVSLEAFYKHTVHLLQYRNWTGLQPPAARWDKDVTEGKGRALGLELDADYRTPRVTATLAYTLSWSKRRFPELYAGWFTDQFDNRHKLNITARYALTGRVTVYAAWTLRSGNRATLPVAYVPQPQMPGEPDNFEAGFVYDRPNNFRLPAYHRLDVGANFSHTTRRGFERIWNVSIYNAYCHLNTMYIRVKPQPDGTFTARSKGFIPLIPSVSYTLKF